MVAYIDLNPVRAGFVEDPKNYRFCGYVEAVACESKAQRGNRSGRRMRMVGGVTRCCRVWHFRCTVN